jgi:hypothetical protein
VTLVGTVDVRRLLYSVSCLSAFKLPTLAGIAPENEFVSKENTWRAVIPPILAGMAPVMELSNNNKTSNAVSAPILDGRGPTR